MVKIKYSLIVFIIFTSYLYSNDKTNPEAVTCYYDSNVLFNLINGNIILTEGINKCIARDIQKEDRTKSINPQRQRPVYMDIN